NARTGRLPETSAGKKLDGNFFPETNDGREFFGGSSPSTDWMKGGFLFDYQPSRYVSNVYADLHFRRIDGDQTLGKSGAIFTTGANQIYPGATGLVDFAFPSQKDVDYQSYLASAGADSSLGNVNWQFDFSYARHDLEAETTEVNFLFDPDGTPPPVLPAGTEPFETEIYKEDTELQVGKFDVSVARHITPTFYLYGAGMFSYERSDPEPEQEVGGPGFQLRTRQTDTSKVTRLSPVVSVGSVFHPVPAVAVRLDTSFKYSMLEGRITEIRDEIAFLTGDTGVATSKVDRDDYIGRASLSIDSKFTDRMSGSFDVRYRYRHEDVDSLRTLTFVGRLPEREEFTSDRHRIEVGPSIRYRLRRGRTIEAGYQFLHEDFEVDVDELAEQFILNDFDVLRHRVFAKARGRIAQNLRGEMRVEYVNERRDMDRPLVDVDIFALTSGDGETERESWSIIPSIYYQPHKHWNLSASLAVQQLTVELVSPDSDPPSEDELADFEYDVLTETLTVGATYRPDEKWSGSFSYSLFNSGDSVDNTGHSARLAGDFRLDDTWRVHGQYGFYSYRRDGTGVDDYDAHVISLGVNASF
ncbi:MAG: hypothetical protein JRE71_18490, partial [Deltaproteobacteria bacterium]|nr:hypothetical protein [Deltaproteobacteria bacterium]